MANKKYTDLPSGTFNSTRLIATGDSATGALAAVNLLGLIGFKFMLAQITQTGIAAPVLTPRVNTLGAVPVPAYAAAGTYLVSSTGLFPAGKTMVITQSSREDDISDVFYFNAFRASNNDIEIDTGKYDFTVPSDTRQDDILGTQLGMDWILIIVTP